jgi:DNA-binding response OmpR family regulator
MPRRIRGREILVVEDEPFIALDISEALETAGASVVVTNTLKEALLLVERDKIEGAILDHGLGDGDSSPLCVRLHQRGIPFLIYSGFGAIDGACQGAPHLPKPATEQQIVEAMGSLFGPKA